MSKTILHFSRKLYILLILNNIYILARICVHKLVDLKNDFHSTIELVLRGKGLINCITTECDQIRGERKRLNNRLEEREKETQTQTKRIVDFFFLKTERDKTLNELEL